MNNDNNNKTYLIKNTCIVTDNKRSFGDVLIKNKRIEKIGSNIGTKVKVVEINGSNQYLLPGCIDDQVHFREPGLTHKANIYTESKAAVAGGVTSFMEMPNTTPPRIYARITGRKVRHCKQDFFG